ncbi:RE1 [Symbiodinium sp. CCMP2592]|nr:RE1 [Symbiodinium sp. CCMP2592]
MPPTQQPATASTGPTTAEGSTGFQLPWAAIPKFIPGTTDVTEYSRKLEFLAAMWPKEHLSLLAPRAALQVEGTAFKKIASLPPDKLKSSDESGIKLLVSTLGGSCGKTDLEAKYDVFEKALYGTVQKQDETNDSYLARHDVHFEELLSQSVTFEQVRAYILLRQSQLTSEDRKKIILELGGSLDYKKVCSSIRLLGSRFFADLQGQRVVKSRTYDANVVEEPPEEGEKMVPAMTASAAVEEAEVDLDEGFMEAMLASEDQDALQVQAFEEELESFFQDTPELQEALVSYMEARNRLLAKKKSRFWPIGGSKGAPKGGRSFKGGGKGKGKHREQLLARIARSNCRICGEKRHWKAECPRRKGNPSSEATTTVAEAFMDVSQVADQAVTQEILTSLPADALTLEEALCTYNPVATLAQQASHVEAILDTGASRCVMGKSLLQKFIGQLSDSVRSKIRVQKSAIRMAQSSQDVEATTSRAPTASLGTRLVKLRDPTMSLSMAEIEALSLEKHGAFLVNFGTKMKGRTFMDCVEEGSDWTKWFVDHYHDSGKREHKVFINFVEKYVSQAEQLEVELRGEPAVIKSDKPRKTSMLSQAAPKARAREDGPEIPWEMLEEPALQDQVATLNSRMSQMEQVMQEMISAIRQLNALMQSQPTLSELRMFLRKVPWHLFAESTARAAVIAPNPAAQMAANACAQAYQQAEEAAWNVYQDSMLTYSQPSVRALGGLAQRFTLGEGDLETAEGEGIARKARRKESSAASPSASVQAPEVLPDAQRQSIFESAVEHAVKERFPDLGILQVFVGKGCRQLQYPLGALPPTDRTTMPGTSKRARIPAAESQNPTWKDGRLHQFHFMGHPDPKKLSEHLRAAGEDKQLVEAALDYQCAGYRAYVVHVLDESSCFHLGTPKLVYVDPAGEFRSEATLEAFQRQNIKTFVTAAAWQRGRVERHGDIVKSMLSRLDKESPITNDSSLDQALHQVFNAKNALVRHKGYAPEQIVLGRSVRIPGSITSDEEWSSHALTEGDDLEAEAHRRRLDLRCRARQAFFEADNCQTIRRAMLRRSHPVGGTVRPRSSAKKGSLREWQSLSTSVSNSETVSRVGGASTFVDLTIPNPEITAIPNSSMNASPSGSPELAVLSPVPVSGAPAAQGTGEGDNDIAQPEQELTPQVSIQTEAPVSLDAPEVERDAAAPSDSVQPTVEYSEPGQLDAASIPVPDSEEGLYTETALLASHQLGVQDSQGEEIMDFTTLQTSDDFQGPPLAEDNFPYVEDLKRWASEAAPEQLEVKLFEQAKAKELQCWELRQLLQMKDDEVCQLLGNAYGRVDAPLLFYKELSKQLEALGFIRHPLEPCVFLLYTQGKLNGILGVHVDDGACGGDAVFLDKIQTLQKTLPFGSRKFRDFVFTGIRLEQMPDFTIRASQGEYIRQVLPIDVGRNRRQNPESPATEEERSKLRGFVGSVQYAVTHTRPDIAAKLGEIQSQITTATVQTLLTANRVLREAQEFDQVCVHFLSIPADQLTFVSFGDASFASSKNLNSHQGVLVCATNGQLSKNQEAPVSPLAWVSKKIPRVVRSTLSAEAYAMSKAVDLLGWLRALWGVVHVPHFDWRQPEKSYKLLNTALVVTDCKSLFDLVTRLAMPSCEEHRTTLEVLLIKQRCAENAQFRWIPTTLQVADSLTKNMDPSLLRTVLAQGRFRLFDTSESLARDAQRRKAIEWLQQPSAASSRP